jgi:hypothetical protein
LLDIQGIDTTAGTIQFGLKMLMKHVSTGERVRNLRILPVTDGIPQPQPETQRKIRAELLLLDIKNRLPNYDDVDSEKVPCERGVCCDTRAPTQLMKGC